MMKEAKMAKDDTPGWSVRTEKIHGRAVARTKKDESWLELHFDAVLQHRGHDWKVYKNEWEKNKAKIREHVDATPFGSFDQRLARRIASDMPSYYTSLEEPEFVYWLLVALMADGTGVESVVITPYTIKVFKSAAVSDSAIIDIVNQVGLQLWPD